MSAGGVSRRLRDSFCCISPERATQSMLPRRNRCALCRPSRPASTLRCCPGPDGPGNHSVSPPGFRILAATPAGQRCEVYFSVRARALRCFGNDEGPAGLRPAANTSSNAGNQCFTATPPGGVGRIGGVVRRWRCADLRLVAVIPWDKNLASARGIGAVLISRGPLCDPQTHGSPVTRVVWSAVFFIDSTRNPPLLAMRHSKSQR